METKKTHVLTPKSFLVKTTQKAAASAAGFLQAHRDFLLTGELASVASPIIARLDARELLPTPALGEIQRAVLGHIVAMDLAKAEEKLNQPASGGGTQKPWLATIRDEKGNICTRINSKGEKEDLVQAFDTAAPADRWCDRRLVEGASDWYALVEHTLSPVVTRIDRNEAVARLLKNKPGPVCAKQSKASMSRLGFQGKAKQDRAVFSHG